MSNLSKCPRGAQRALLTSARFKLCFLSHPSQVETRERGSIRVAQGDAHQKPVKETSAHLFDDSAKRFGFGGRIWVELQFRSITRALLPLSFHPI